jgi:GR25 family glycosyltransferase involved in LPS biosynthesis
MDRLQRSIPKCEFRIIRVEAVDGQDTFFASQSKFLSRSQEACWLSHQAAFQIQITSNLEFCLILEDDADFAARKFRVHDLEQLCSQMRTQGIHVMQLGHLHRHYRWWSPSRLLETVKEIVAGKRTWVSLGLNRRLPIVLDSFRSGAHAYLLSFDAAKELVHLNAPPVFTADDFLGLLAKSESSELRVARSRKSLIAQWGRPSLKAADLDSDIEVKQLGHNS